MVKVVTTKDEFDTALKDYKEKLVVVDFFADWCSPCKAIAPKFEALSEDPKYKDKVVFLKVNVDDADEVAQFCKISAMPTFQFYRNEKKVGQFEGARVDKLLEMLDEYAT